MFSKHEKVPDPEQANWFLFSMHGIEGIRAYLTKFPKEDIPNRGTLERGVSVTLAWSGEGMLNVPVTPYNDLTFGFVLNPNSVIIPQADSLARESLGFIVKEISKIDAIKEMVDGAPVFHTSKYPEKKGYYRGNLYTNNLARHERIPGVQQSIYHPTSNLSVFAKNIWRKYFNPKREWKGTGSMTLNEGVTFQKDDCNPICGLFITSFITSDDAVLLSAILKEQPQLKLYLYDVNAKEHIMRVIENGEAIGCLQRESFHFQELFSKAEYFKGYPQSALHESKATML